MGPTCAPPVPHLPPLPPPPAGDVEQDFWLAFDLLRSRKDQVEFAVVRDWVQLVSRGNWQGQGEG